MAAIGKRRPHSKIILIFSVYPSFSNTYYYSAAGKMWGASCSFYCFISCLVFSCSLFFFSATIDGAGRGASQRDRVRMGGVGQGGSGHGTRGQRRGNVCKRRTERDCVWRDEQRAEARRSSQHTRKGGQQGAGQSGTSIR